MGLRKRYLPWLACVAVGGIGIPAIASAAGSSGSGAELAPGQIMRRRLRVREPGRRREFRHDQRRRDRHVQLPDRRELPQRRLRDHRADDVHADGGRHGHRGAAARGRQGRAGPASCRFNTPGTYAFVCQAHSFMTGSVVVQAVGPTPTPTATATADADGDGDGDRHGHSDGDRHADADATATATATPTATATATPTATATATPTATATATPTATADGDADGHRHGDADGRPRRATPTATPTRDAHGHRHRDAHGHRDRDAHGHRDRDADGDPHGHADPARRLDGHRDADRLRPADAGARPRPERQPGRVHPGCREGLRDVGRRDGHELGR